MTNFTPIICIDFDGVIHSYTSGWQGKGEEGAKIVADPPVPGAIAWLYELIDAHDVEPQIYSSRSRQEGGILAMKEWLIKHGLDELYVDQLKFPTQKPAAFLTIDDRAICFNGEFPSISTMLNFKPWYKREGWQPIATAPHNTVLAGKNDETGEVFNFVAVTDSITYTTPGPHYELVRRSRNEVPHTNGWRTVHYNEGHAAGYPVGVSPTHWMRLRG